MLSSPRSEIIQKLQDKILHLQGFRQTNNSPVDVALSPIKDALPNGVFPLGAVHEFLCGDKEEHSATSGFISGLLGKLMERGGITLWASSNRTLFPPALRSFGIQPDRFVFVDLKKERDVLWVMDEAMKCDALTAVVGEIRDLDFNTSRRLQLAVEQSKVTGFVIRGNTHSGGPMTKQKSTACVSRWRITHIPSESIDGLPGIGFPQWNVNLLRIRNGKPGSWRMRWQGGRFLLADIPADVIQEQQKKAG